MREERRKEMKALQMYTDVGCAFCAAERFLLESVSAPEANASTVGIAVVQNDCARI